MMRTNAIRWLLDIDLPRTSFGSIDALHAGDLPRRPGPCGIREAASLGRTLVTCDKEFGGPWAAQIDHPGVLILDVTPHERMELERSLAHVAFRVRQYGGALQLAGNRFLVQSDRDVLQIMPDGTEVDLAPWRKVSITGPRPISLETPAAGRRAAAHSMATS